jgi:polysaccharide pyruvyl transferase WcaK-like protein
MKTNESRPPKIMLLGNNSGRNLGDAAILASILDALSAEVPNAQFFVPTISPKFVNENYGSKYNVKGINIMPWTGSLRLLGIPTLYYMAKSDIALICDGIIFGRKLFSPHNFLITLIFLVPWAKLFGCKIICYSCGIGPFPSYLSRIFARFVIKNSDLVIMRDHDSKKLAETIGVKNQIDVTGDAAFLNKVADDQRTRQIAENEGIDLNIPILGINVTPYMDSWLKKSERMTDKSGFLTMIADGIALAKRNSPEIEATQVIVFSCSPMDEAFSYNLAKATGGCVIHNSKYLSHDIQGLMRHCELFIGMRFHSLVLACAVGAPVMGLIYAPKVRGLMSLLECQSFGMELADLTSAKFGERLLVAWQERKILQKKQQRIIDGLKQGAGNAAKQISHRYFAVQ